VQHIGTIAVGGRCFYRALRHVRPTRENVVARQSRSIALSSRTAVRRRSKRVRRGPALGSGSPALSRPLRNRLCVLFLRAVKSPRSDHVSFRLNRFGLNNTFIDNPVTGNEIADSSAFPIVPSKPVDLVFRFSFHVPSWSRVYLIVPTRFVFRRPVFV